MVYEAPPSLEDPPLPSFMRPRSTGASTTNVYENYDFWVPLDRTCCPTFDFALGYRHFSTALAFAWSLRVPMVLPAIVSAIALTGFGDMERGFISHLSRKAYFGRLPEPLSLGAMEAAVRYGATTKEELAHGEQEAQEVLRDARDLRAPEIIECYMEMVAKREMKFGADAFSWTVCGAAYLGGAN